MTQKSLVLTFALAATAAIATASTSKAQGLSFEGAYIEANYVSNVYNGTYDYSQTGVYGAVEVAFGNIGIQADLGVFGYDADPMDSTYYALHAMYRFSPNLVVGGYYGQDSFNVGINNTWSTYGLEVKFTPSFLNQRMTIEAFVGAYDFNGPDVGNPMIGVGVNYAATDSIDLGVSYLRGAWPDLSDPADQDDVLELEATYSLSNGLYATASYTNTIYPGSNWQDASYGITMGYAFGGGTTFDRRGYSGLYPGD